MQLYVIIAGIICYIGSASLQKLDISKNEIGDQGVKLICEELKHNKTLSHLLVFNCGLSLQGISCALFSIICK